MFIFKKAPDEYQNTLLPEDVVTIQYKIGDSDIDRNDLILEFLNFLKACGYSVSEEDINTIINL